MSHPSVNSTSSASQQVSTTSDSGSNQAKASASALALSSQAVKSAGAHTDEWDAIKAKTTGTAPKADPKKLAASIDSKGAGQDAGDVLQKGIHDFTNRNVDGPSKDKSLTGVSTAASVVGAAAGITVAVTIAEAGSVASAALGPFFWVGLIATAVAAGTAAIVGAVSKTKKEGVAIAKADGDKQAAAMSEITGKKQTNLINDQLARKNVVADSKKEPVGSGAAAMMESHLEVSNEIKKS